LRKDDFAAPCDITPRAPSPLGRAQPGALSILITLTTLITPWHGATLSATPIGQHQSFALEELEAIQLPEAAVIIQGTLSDNGTAVIWGPRDAWLLQDGTARPLCDDPLPLVLGAAVNASGNWTVITGTSGPTLVSASSDGCARRPVQWSADRISAAVHVGGEWLAITSGGRMLSISGSGGTTPRGQLKGLSLSVLRSTSDTLPVWLAPAGDKMILGVRTPPFTWVYRDRLQEVFAVNPLQLDIATAEREMISTGVLSVEGGFLQVLGDMTSTKRHLVLFNEAGSPVRTSEIPIPFGILATNVHSSTLLALRRTDRLEVVLYGYSWRPPVGRN
jgi:hypothetical protein